MITGLAKDFCGRSVTQLLSLNTAPSRIDSVDIEVDETDIDKFVDIDVDRIDRGEFLEENF